MLFSKSNINFSKYSVVYRMTISIYFICVNNFVEFEQKLSTWTIIECWLTGKTVGVKNKSIKNLSEKNDV